MKKSTHNYIFNNGKGYVEEVHGDYIEKWMICPCVAIKLPDLYEPPAHIKHFSPHFIMQLLKYDNVGFVEYENFFINTELLKSNKKMILTTKHTNKFGYNSLLVKLFDYKNCKFQMNMRSGMLYVYDDTDDMIGLILPVKMTKEVIEGGED